MNRLPGMSRKIPSGSDNNNDKSGSDGYQQQCFNVDDFQILAKKKLEKALYEYLASGSDDEQTLSENSLAFKRWYLRPRVLSPVGNINTRTVLRFGGNTATNVSHYEYPVAMPVFVSPAGVHALCDDDGECATVRACANASILFGLSQHSTRSIEEVAAASSSSLNFYQAYILKDRKRTLSLISRAIRAGYKGIFLTVDSVRFGYRECDARNGFNALPPPHRLVNYDYYDDNDNNDSPTVVIDESNDSSTGTNLDRTYNSQENKSWDQNSEQMFEQNVSWEDVTWIKEELKERGKGIPLIVKGIMTAEDAILAVQAGADVIMVSNHGGRQLDGCMATIDVLPEVVRAVNGIVPIWLDGGIRRGTDVLKALALGASAVGIGKPVFFSLGVGGEDAVSYMLHLLQTELEAAMAICGIERIEDIKPSHVTRHPLHDKGMSFRESLIETVVRSSL
jgi:(S)-2-hydroxy-acid oxidase